MSHPDLLAQLLHQADQLPARQSGLADVVPVSQALQTRKCGESPNGFHQWKPFMGFPLDLGVVGAQCECCGLVV